MRASLRTYPALASTFDTTPFGAAGRNAHRNATSGNARFAPSICACDKSGRATQLAVVVRLKRLTNDVPNGRSSDPEALKVPVCPAIDAGVPFTERNDPGPPSPSCSPNGAPTGAASSVPTRLRVYETSTGANMLPNLRIALESRE